RIGWPGNRLSSAPPAGRAANPRRCIAPYAYNMVVARSQTLVQLTDELVALLDQRAAAEQRSRSELIREAIERYVAADRGAEISRRIVSGYEQIPRRATTWRRGRGARVAASWSRSAGEPGGDLVAGGAGGRPAPGVRA